MTEGDIRWIKNWQAQQIGNNMNRFYKKPKPETMKANREFYADTFKKEIKWLGDNLTKLQSNKNKFLIDMYTILVTGSRKITPKMATAIQNGIKRCNNHPKYNEALRIEADAKLKPILEKISLVRLAAEKRGDYAIQFIDDVLAKTKQNYKISKKQMEALNKIYKRCSEDLFKGDDNEGK